MNLPYIELHARSAFSFHRGASPPDDLVARAAETGLPALALCDRDGVYGAPRFFRAAREYGIRPLVGCEITLDDGTVLPLLVQTRTGYQQLCRLLTRSKLRAPKNEGIIQWNEIGDFTEGLICLTGDREGPLQQALQKGDPSAANTCLKQLISLFGPDRVYIEIQRWHLRGERRLIQQLEQLARHWQLPLLATNGVCYARPGGRRLFDAFTCLHHHTHLDGAGTRLSGNHERYLKSPAQMQQLFHDLPAALQNTLTLAERLEFTLEDLGYQFPRYPTRPSETEASVLRRETFAGAQKRYPRITPAVRRQLEHELQLIQKLGFCGYFLIVWGIVCFARQKGILVQGRGSAANSAVCYSLSITNVDPVESKLLFERFLSEGRESWPDIDLDLPSGNQRESVIQEVYRRFAPRGAAMTANVISYRGRSAMREMGKVLQIPDDVLGRFSDLFARGDLPETRELKDQIRQAGLPLNHPRLPALVHLYRAVHGLPRHLGQHSGGMIISDQGLDSVVPLENASMPGRVVVQWDKDDCEDLGIIKVDLLGLGMMAAIEETLEICRARGPEREVELAAIPKDDAATFELMQRADTVGVFQIESRAQMATLPRMKPRTFYDVVIETAIIRPGPIVGKLVHPYLNRRNGREPVTYIDDRFKPALERTLGIPLFQEQVLKMAMIIADFSGSEAEELRRALSFNRSRERMEKVMVKLRAAMTAKEVAPEAQENIIRSIQSFALYGFPESHAISFALLAYASCWLKVHRAVEFYVGLLNNQPMGFYSCASLVEDARHRGLRVRPVSVVHSEMGARVENDRTLRLGLRQVRGLSHRNAEQLLEERARQPWQSLEDFQIRTHLNRDERRLLAKVGALKELSTHRRDALWRIEETVDEDDLFYHAVRKQNQEAHSSQRPEIEPMLPAMNAMERLQADYDGLRLTTGAHPMALIRQELTGVWTARDLAQVPDGRTATIAGLVICRQRPRSAKGHVFISLEDETGISNAFVPSKVFETYRLVITQEPFLRIRGRVQNTEGVISLYTQHVDALTYETFAGPQSHDFH